MTGIHLLFRLLLLAGVTLSFVLAKINHRTHRHAIIQPPADKLKPFASIVYSAVVKGKVALPCNIEPPAAGDEVVLVLWYKDDSPAPIFTLDARRGDLDRARHVDRATQSELGTRAYFNMANKPAFLQVDLVQEADAGEYRCRVDFKRSRSINTVISLRVVVPPGEPVILDENGKRLQGAIGPFNEGDPLKLTCQAEHGKPRPAVTWWKDFRMIDDSYAFSQEEGVVKNVLEIAALARSDALTGFVCKAANNNVTVAASTSITIHLNLKPQDVIIQPAERPVSADSPVDLTCTSSGSRPPAILSWWRGNQQVRSKVVEKSRGKADVQSVLTFTPTVEDHGRIISCRAENSIIPGSALEQAWKLDVHYAPRVSLSLASSHREGEITEGQDVVLDCKVASNPLSSHVGWLFQGREVLVNATAGVVISGQSLVIQRVAVEHRGIYTCYATNEEGKGVSNEYMLNIKFAPVCKPKQRFTYGVTGQDTVAIDCFVDSEPADGVTFRWVQNSSSGSSKDISDSFSISGSRSTLLYKALLDEDFGSLLCWAQNSVGMQHEPCVFSLITAGPPDAVHNCSQINATEDGMTIECAPGMWDGGLSNQVFIAEVYEAESSSKIPVANISAIAAATSSGGERRLGQHNVWAHVKNGTQNACTFRSRRAETIIIDRCTVSSNAKQSVGKAVCLYDRQQVQVATYGRLFTASVRGPFRPLAYDGEPMFDSDLSVPVFIIRQIADGQSFRVVIYANNAKGPSPPFVLMAQTPRPAERYTADVSAMMAFRPMVGIAIGVVITVFIAAGILIGVYRCRVNLKRDKESHASAFGEKDISLGSQEKPLTLVSGGTTSSTEADLEKTSPDVIPMPPSMPLGSVGGTRRLQDFVDLESSSEPMDFSYQHLAVLDGLPEGIVDPLCRSTPPSRHSAKELEMAVGPSVVPLSGDSSYTELVLATNVMLTPADRAALGRSSSGSTAQRKLSSGGIPTEYARIDFHRTLRPVPGGHLLAAEDHSAYPIVGDIEPSMALEATTGIESSV